MAKTLIKKYDIQPLIDEKWESDAKPYRSSNIGASSIGCPCQRSTFLSFRWASPIEDFKGQMLRLFDVGTREEDIMVDNLKNIGFDIRYTGKDQLKMQIAPHVICRPDGVIFNGIPDIDEYPVNFEMKTMNRSNFEKLEKQGLRNSKPEYYDQAQCEMYGENTELETEVKCTLFVALCKDDSRIYAEIIDANPDYMELILKRARNIVFGNSLPEEYSIDPEFSVCKYCSNSVFCHVTHETTEINCRTCAWSKPEENSTWTCRVYPGSPIPYDAQKKGCPCHSFNPLLVPYKVNNDKTKKWHIAYEKSDGTIVYNGYKGVPSKLLKESMIEEKVDDNANPLDITFD